MVRVPEETGSLNGNATLLRALGLSQCSQLTHSVYKGYSQDYGWVSLKIAQTSLAKTQLDREVTFLSAHESHYWPQYLASGNGATYDWLMLSYEEGTALSAHDIALPKMNSLIESLQNALSHLHSFDYIHGDVKPANILITNDGSIKFIDFGSVLPIGVTYSSLSSSSISPRFSAPNPHFRQGHTHPKDDFFSLAVIVQSLYGCHPFQLQSIVSYCQQTRDYEPDTKALPTRYQMLVLQSIARTKQLLAQPLVQ
ncbi:hypothetical protein AKJ18_20450 [Vibrio xuii]|nr:hypothetical protein AKJ18_20450 [Vibrio xuii]